MNFQNPSNVINSSGKLEIHDCIYKYFDSFNKILSCNNSIKRNIGAKCDLIVTIYCNILSSITSNNLIEDEYQDILKPIFCNNTSDGNVTSSNNNKSVSWNTGLVSNDFNAFKENINYEIVQKANFSQFDKKTFESVLNDFKKEEMTKCEKSKEIIKYFHTNIDKYQFFNSEQMWTNKPNYYDEYITEIKGMLKQRVLNRNRRELNNFSTQNVIEKHSVNTAYAIVEFMTQNAKCNTILFLPSRQKNKLNNNNITSYLYDVGKYLNNISKGKNDAENVVINNVTKVKQEMLERIMIYKFYSGRSQILDDEFQMLCTLVLDSDDIVKDIKNNIINQMNINIFTYMDMCPACWSAWDEFKPKLNTLYTELLNLTKNIDVNVTVNTHSIRPYDDRDHLFIREYNRFCNLQNKEHDNFVPIAEWNNTSYDGNYYRRNNKKLTLNNSHQFNVKQYVDSNGVNEVQKFVDEKEQNRKATKK